MSTTFHSRLDSLRRSALSGLCHSVFGVVILFGLCVPLPLLALFSSHARRAPRVRRLASFGFRLLIRMIEACGLARIEVQAREAGNLAGCLLVANHPSYLDAVFLMAHLPQANCVIKPALLRHPLLFPFTRLGGYLATDPADPTSLIDACRRAAECGEPILIFAEGTRSTPGAPLRLQRGAAQIALRAGLRVVPLVVHCDPPALTHGHPWYRMPDSRVRLVIRFGPPCEVADFAGEKTSGIPRMARLATRGMENYFTRQLASTPDEPLPPP